RPSRSCGWWATAAPAPAAWTARPRWPRPTGPTAPSWTPPAASSSPTRSTTGSSRSCTEGGGDDGRPAPRTRSAAPGGLRALRHTQAAAVGVRRAQRGEDVGVEGAHPLAGAGHALAGAEADVLPGHHHHRVLLGVVVGALLHVVADHHRGVVEEAAVLL